MKEIKGDLWEFLDNGFTVAITTNGTVKKNGLAVMGRGCAYEATQRFPEFPKLLGENLKKSGNWVTLYQCFDIITFPVKHNWWEKADLCLIEKSAKDLMLLMDQTNIETVVLPKPGCGNGGLDWKTEVKPILECLLDDRIWVIGK